MKKNTVKIDWFCFTIKTPVDSFEKRDVVLLMKKYFSEFFKPGIFVPLDGTNRFYNRCLHFDYKINIRYNHNNLSVNNNMGINIEVTGSGLDYLRENLKQNDIEMYFYYKIKEIHQEYDVNITRIDLAYDDFKSKPYLPISKIEKALKRGDFVSRTRVSRNLELLRMGEKRKKEQMGNTLYIGSNESSRRLRLYDKKLEQMNKVGHCDVSNWLRYEMVFKKEKAKKVFENFRDLKLVDIFFNSIEEFIRFVVPSIDTNKARLKTADFWLEFLKSRQEVKPFVIIPEPKPADIVKVTNWLVSISSAFQVPLTLLEKNDIKIDTLDYSKLNKKQKELMKSFEELSENEKKDVVEKLKMVLTR